MRIEGNGFIMGLLVGGLLMFLITFSLGIYDLNITEEPVEDFIQNQSSVYPGQSPEYEQVKVCDEWKINQETCFLVEDNEGNTATLCLLPLDRLAKITNATLTLLEREEPECIDYHYEWINQEVGK